MITKIKNIYKKYWILKTIQHHNTDSIIVRSNEVDFAIFQKLKDDKYIIEPDIDNSFNSRHVDMAGNDIPDNTLVIFKCLTFKGMSYITMIDFIFYSIPIVISIFAIMLSVISF